MKLMLLFCALVSATAVAADDMLYQKQRLQRQFQQDQLNLKRQQQSMQAQEQAQGQGKLTPVDKQRLTEKHNRQLLRQQRLFQSQRNQIQRSKNSAERLYEQQKFKRMQDSQALEFKWQQH